MNKLICLFTLPCHVNDPFCTAYKTLFPPKLTDEEFVVVSHDEVPTPEEAEKMANIAASQPVSSDRDTPEDDVCYYYYIIATCSAVVIIY